MVQIWTKKDKLVMDLDVTTVFILNGTKDSNIRNDSNMIIKLFCEILEWRI